MEPEAMVYWQIFVAIFTAGNRLRPKNGKKLWISKLEYRQHIRGWNCDGYGNLWLYPNRHATGFNGWEVYGYLLAASQTTYVTCNWILWNRFRWVIHHIKNNIKLQIELQGLLFLIVWTYKHPSSLYNSIAHLHFVTDSNSSHLHVVNYDILRWP